MNRVKHKTAFWLIGLTAAVAAIIAIAWTTAERAALSDLEARGQASLSLRAEALRGWLDKFQPLAAVYAQDPDVVALLDGDDSPIALARVNQRLVDWNNLTGAADTYLLDGDGVAVAASNWDQDWRFVGNNYSFRPYFQQAREGRLGRYFALGTSTGKRGYYFAHPVRRHNRLLGVIVVKVAVAGIESDLQDDRDQVFVTDRSGVIVLAGDPAWRLKSYGPLPPGARDRIFAQRQFDLETLTPAVFDGTTPASGPLGRFAAIAGPGGVAEMLHLTRPMATEGWVLHFLTPTASAYAEARLAAALAGAGALILMLAAFIGLQRRRRLLDRMRDREAANLRMEQAVRDRTADLSASNARLAEEVDERRAAEQRLKSAQQELIQAGKLAALGQMSTSLSHEFNQPLAAICAYADNAVAFLKLGREAEVSDNLTRISKLTHRMAELSRNLTSFARKPRDSIAPTPLGPVIDQSIELLQGRLQRAGVDLARPDFGAMAVMGGPTRLQQVFVNVIGNAVDACARAQAPAIRISVARAADEIAVTVEDNGPGVPGDVLEKIFDPFFTTKDAGKGLGLGLSISFNILKDVGGSISAENSPKDAAALGGARFIIRLRAAPAPQTAELTVSA